MDRIAYIAGGVSIYWNSIVLTLAAATAMCFFLAFYLRKSGNAAAAFAALPLCLGLSLVFARFFHWYCRTDTYPGFLTAMTDYSQGSFALMGVFLGCFLGAWLLKAVGLHRNLPQMLDCMSVAGAAGICVGRLSSFFNSSSRGQVVSFFKTLPFAYPVTNAVSGATEYRFATFLFQSLVALTLFLWLRGFLMKPKMGKKDGDTCLVFLMFYGCSQVVLDSTRYDSLFFRSNGFVSIVQVLGAVALVGTIVVFSVRLVKKQGMKGSYLLLWIPMTGAIGAAGFMEYYVQRHGSTALMSYGIMSLCLVFTTVMTMKIWSMAGKSNGKNRNFVR